MQELRSEIQSLKESRNEDLQPIKDAVMQTQGGFEDHLKYVETSFTMLGLDSSPLPEEHYQQLRTEHSASLDEALWEQFCLSDQSALLSASVWRNPL